EGNLTSCFGSGGLLQNVGHAIDWVNLQAKFAGVGVGIVVGIDGLGKIMRAEFASEREEGRPGLLFDSPAGDARGDRAFDPLNVTPRAGRIILQLAYEGQSCELGGASQRLGGCIPLLR